MCLALVHPAADGHALTRRYLVAPCWKNTQSAGLEVLKGLQDSAQGFNLVLTLGTDHPQGRASKGAPDRIY